MSLFDKATAIASTLASKAKAAALNVSEIELKVQEATNLDPWGPHGTSMSEISQASYDSGNYALIMAVVEQRLLCTGPQWRHVYKSLLLLEFMAKQGPTRVVEYLRASQSMLTRLQEGFEYRDENGRDQGINVRERAKHIMALINDDARLKAERDKAAKNANKYTGISSVGGHSGSSSPRTVQAAPRRAEDDAVEATRARIERLKADGALPDAPPSGELPPGIDAPAAPKPKKKLSDVRINPTISAAISSLPVAAPSLLSSQTSYTASPAPPPQASPLDLLSDLDAPSTSSATFGPAFPGPSTSTPAFPPTDDDWSNFSAAPAPSRIDVEAMLNISSAGPPKNGPLPLESFAAIPPQPLPGRPNMPPPGALPGFGSAPRPTAPPSAFGAAPPATIFDPFAAAPAPSFADPFAPVVAAAPAPAMPLNAANILVATPAAAPKPKLGPETASAKKKNDPFADLLSL